MKPYALTDPIVRYLIGQGASLEDPSFDLLYLEARVESCVALQNVADCISCPRNPVCGLLQDLATQRVAHETRMLVEHPNNGSKSASDYIAKSGTPSYYSPSFKKSEDENVAAGRIYSGGISPAKHYVGRYGRVLTAIGGDAQESGSVERRGSTPSSGPSDRAK